MCTTNTIYLVYCTTNANNLVYCAINTIYLVYCAISTIYMVYCTTSTINLVYCAIKTITWYTVPPIPINLVQLEDEPCNSTITVSMFKSYVYVFLHNDTTAGLTHLHPENALMLTTIPTYKVVPNPSPPQKKRNIPFGCYFSLHYTSQPKISQLHPHIVTLMNKSFCFFP